MGFSIFRKIQLSLPVGWDYCDYHNFYHLSDNCYFTIMSYIFCISDNHDYFLHKIDHNNLGVLTKHISQNNTETFHKTIMILCIEKIVNTLFILYFSWFFLNPWHVPLCFISLILRFSQKYLSRNTKIAKIWSCKTRETRENFAKHRNIFASFVFRENPEKSFVKNPSGTPTIIDFWLRVLWETLLPL